MSQTIGISGNALAEIRWALARLGYPAQSLEPPFCLDGITVTADPPAHHFVIYGMPRTKKTSNQGVVVQTKSGSQRAVMFPAKDWRDWCKKAPIKFVTERPTRPLTQRFSCRAHYYMTARQHGDAVGYNQGLADFLEVRGIPGIKEVGLLENDRLIVDWDGTRGPWHGPQFIDPVRPRVEVMLTVVPLTL